MDMENEENRETPPETGEKPSYDLLAQLVQANYNAYADTTGKLLASYRKDAARERAVRELIQSGIEDLLGKPFVPAGRVLHLALYPDVYDPDAVKKRMRELLKEEDK